MIIKIENQRQLLKFPTNEKNNELIHRHEDLDIPQAYVKVATGKRTFQEFDKLPCKATEYTAIYGLGREKIHPTYGSQAPSGSDLRARARELNTSMLLFPGRKSERKVSCLDSKTIAKELVSGIVESVIHSGCSDLARRTNGTDNSIAETTLFLPLIRKVAVQGLRFVGEVSDIISFIGSIARSKEYMYTLHYFRYILFPKRGFGCLVNDRFRCLRHNKNT